MSSPRPILLVEDNADDEMLALDALARLDLSNPVLVARDGVAALELLLPVAPAAGATRPVLLLLDLKLPRLSGFEVLRAVRADPRTAALPVVVLSTSRERRDIDESYESGANSYVCKPVAFDAFVWQLQQIAHYWLDLNVAPGA
jgi:two-component system response regulator